MALSTSWPWRWKRWWPDLPNAHHNRQNLKISESFPILASVKRKAHGITPMEIHEKPCEGPDSRNAVEAAAIAALNWTRSHTAQFCVGQWGPYGECNRPTSGSCHWKFPLATIINPSQCFHYLPFIQKKTTYNRVRICPLKHH